MMLSAKKRKTCAGLVLAALLLVLPGLASAATFYVSTTGDDIMGFGTIDNPWKTITKAATSVPAGTAGSPNVIMVEAGTYDVTTNGEVFPITFANDYVTLTGAGAATTIIDPEEIGTADALHLDAVGISVSGFTFRNISNGDAIAITEGGFNIHHNVFEATVSDGISFYPSEETDRTTSIAFPDMSITNNTISTTQNGVYVYLNIDFESTVSGLTVSFGNFDVSNNTFPLTGGDGIYISNLFDVSDITNGTVTIGDFTANNNTITGGDVGISFYGSVYDMDDAQVTVGNVEISSNTCTNQSMYGINIDYWDMGYFYGTTNAVFGDFTVSGNTVQATNYAVYTSTNGIYITDIDYIEYLYDETTVTTGNINVDDNTVDVHNYGIYLDSYGIYYIGTGGGGDSVSVTTGSRTFTGNTLNSDQYYGMYLDFEYIGYEMYGTSTVNYGSFNISGNTITSRYESLYVYLYEVGYDLDEDSSVTLGSMIISNNTLTSANAEALYYEFYECGNYDIEGNSAVQFGPTGITNNTLTAGGGDAGMEFYFDYVAYEMYDNASFAMAPITVNNNTINATDGDGIYINYYDYDVGSYLYGNSTATLPDWVITGNTIDVTGGYYGIDFYTYSNPDDNTDSSVVNYGSMLIDNNTFNPDKNAGMDYGIYLYLEDVVENGYVSAAATFGDITITNNRLYAIDTKAIYIEYDEVGYDFSGTPTLTMGDIEIGNNTIDAAPIGIDVYLYELYAEDSATVNIGGLNIHDNTLTNISGEYGIYAYYYNFNNDPGTATLTIGAPNISGNTVSGTPTSDTGISLYVDNSTAGITMGMPTLTGNIVSGFDYGMYLGGLPEAELSCNFIENNNLIGMVFDTNGTNFEVHTNSLVNNTIGLAVYKDSTGVINAENNWWGDKAGPAACASCNGVDPGTSGTVDYTPWMTYQPDRARCGQSFPWLMFMPAITGMGK